MLCHIGVIHDHYFLDFVCLQRLMIEIIPTRLVFLDTVCDLCSSRDRKRLVRPVLRACSGPLRALCLRYGLAEFRGNVLDVCAQLLLDDTRIPHRMEVLDRRLVLRTGPLGVTLIAASVSSERDMERLVDITNPVPEEFERRELVSRGSTGTRQSLEIRVNRRHNAGRVHRTGILRNPCSRAWQVDKVLARTLAWVIRPEAGRRKRRELGVTLDQTHNSGSCLRIQLLEGNLTNNLVSDVAPGIHVVGEKYTK